MTCPVEVPVSGVRPGIPVHGGRRKGDERSLAPKEHGAYGQLALPLFVAMVLGERNLLSWFVAVASVAAFFAHEPLLLVLGQRGKKALRTQSERARSKLIALLVLGVVTLGSAFVWGSWSVRCALGVNLVAALGALSLIVKRRERSTSGELWIAATLPSVVLPIGLLQGLSWRDVFGLHASFALAFAAGIIGVRAVIADFKSGGRWSGAAALAVLLGGVCALGLLSRPAAIGAALYWTAVCVVRVLRPSPRHLRQVGWTLVGASILQAAWLWGTFA
ncbi:MAG: YwiC-like family protein [Polyangiaceae bacterium]